MDFDFPPGGDYHINFQLRGDKDTSLILTEALEIHCISMTKWRKLHKIDIENNALHRWLVWFDQNSPPELIKEVITMDDTIKAADERQAHVTLDWEAQDLYRRRQMALMDQIELAKEHEDYENALRKGREEALREGREEALREGHEKGQEAATLSIARNALAKGLSIEIIQDITGLDAETIEKLA